MALENCSRYAGGVESYAVEIAHWLAEHGWEVHFFGYTWDGEPNSAVFHKIRKLPRWFAPASVRLLDFALCHRNMMRSLEFDVVLGFGNTIVMNVYQTHGGVHSISNVRKLQAVRNPILRIIKAVLLFSSPKYYARAWIEGAPFRSSRRPVVVAISEMVRDDMSSHFGIPREEIALVYNGIDLKRFGAPRGIHAQELRTSLGLQGRVVFLFMAYDLRKKGIRYLVEASSKLRDKLGGEAFKVLVVGRPPYPSLQRLVRKLALSNDVIFLGATDQPEIFYQAADVLVLPTFYDACSLVVFEAMAGGLPVITTKFNGASGIIHHGVDGIVLPTPQDVNALSAAMERFLDKVFLGSASEAARRTARNYDIKANHSKMLTIFTRVSLGRAAYCET